MGEVHSASSICTRLREKHPRWQYFARLFRGRCAHRTLQLIVDGAVLRYLISATLKKCKQVEKSDCEREQGASATKRKRHPSCADEQRRLVAQMLACTWSYSLLYSLI
eukprot:scaffold2808_cov255-Pinguiococcus_pyrenoidosus.AAC.50